MQIGLLTLAKLPPARLVETVRAAEAEGFHCFWHSDEKFFRDPWVGLTLAALPLWVSYPNLGYLDPLPRVKLAPELLEILAKRAYTLIPQAARLVPDELVEHLAVAGTLEDVRARVHAIAATGISQITIHPVAPPGGDALEVVRRFAREVVPSL